MQVSPTVLRPVGYQQITTLSAATALTVPKEARIAFIQAETANVRWRDDGTNPTAGVGMLLLSTSEGMWFTGKLQALRFIEAAAGAKLNVSYYA